MHTSLPAPLSMGKASFSIDFLAQSKSREPSDGGLERNLRLTGKPHVPCLAPPGPLSSSPRTTTLPRPKQYRTGGAQEPNLGGSKQPSLGNECQQSPRKPEPCGTSWSSADECSGDDSDTLDVAGCDPSVSPEDTPGGENQRRMRTAFTSQQISKLEKTFKKQKYLGANERRKLSASVQLSEIQIKTWFQNRRMKLKRQMQDNQHSLLPAASLPHVYYSQGPFQITHDNPSYHYGAQQQSFSPYLVNCGTQYMPYPFQGPDMAYYHQPFAHQHSSFIRW